MDDNTRIRLMEAAEEIMSRRSLSDIAKEFNIELNYTYKRCPGLREPEPINPEFNHLGEKIYY